MDSEEWMQLAKRIAAGVAVVGGVAYTALTSIPNVRTAVSIAGIAPWGWQIIAFAVFAIAMLFIIYTAHRETRKAKAAYDLELLEDRKQSRKRLQNRQEIPTILSKMSDRAQTLMEKKAKEGELFSEDEIQAAIAGLTNIGYDPPHALLEGAMYIAQQENPLTPNMITSKKLDKFWLELETFLVNLQGSMKTMNIGTMALCQDDPTYQGLVRSLKLLEVDLPETIVHRITHYTIVITSLPNILLMVGRVPQDLPAHKGAPIMMPYLAQSLHAYGTKYNYEISRLIERFLSGEDMK